MKANGVEDSLHFIRRETAPIRLETIRIPSFCEPPALVERDDCSAVKLALFAPPVHVRLRPEGKDGRSSERDVVPELTRRHDKMNEADVRSDYV